MTTASDKEPFGTFGAWWWFKFDATDNSCDPNTLPNDVFAVLAGDGSSRVAVEYPTREEAMFAYERASREVTKSVFRTFETGSVRDSREGKGRFDLLPPAALRRLAQHFENGVAKYGERNWEKGQPLQSFLDSALRHINDYQRGLRDEDHLIAAAWNLLALVETQTRIDAGTLPKTLDDFPTHLLQGAK